MRPRARASRRVLAFTLLVVAPLLTATAADVVDPQLEAMREQLARTLPDVRSEDIVRGPIPGYFEVRRGEDFGYVSEDGKFLFIGDAVDLNKGDFVTDRRRRAERLEAIERLPGAVVFAPPAGPRDPAHTLTVFTDVDCRWCRAMHRNIEAYLAQGLTIRYLFNPAGGRGSAAYARALAVICSANQQAALTEAKLGHRVAAPPPGCLDPLPTQIKQAERMNLTATPALILPDGSVRYGAPEPEELARQVAEAATRIPSPGD